MVLDPGAIRRAGLISAGAATVAVAKDGCAPHAVRERLDAGALPAIAISAFARAEEGIQALQVGFQLHIAKPVEPNELGSAVASLAGRTGTST